LSFLPKAWAVIPAVPILRKPKFQYKRSKSVDPMAMPPIAVADPRRPAIAVSAIPTRGIVIPASMLGMARFRICLFRFCLSGFLLLLTGSDRVLMVFGTTVLGFWCNGVRFCICLRQGLPTVSGSYRTVLPVLYLFPQHLLRHNPVLLHAGTR
jgi:hypothetical protein